MVAYIAQRITLLVGIVLSVLVVTFIVGRVLPGSPVEMMLGSKPTQEQIEAAERELGLDQPLPIQLVRYIGEVASGDLGTSLRTGQPVVTDIARSFPATAELVTLALLLSIALGVPLGVMAAVNENGIADYAIRVGTVTGLAVPVFFLGLILQIVFYSQLQLFPLQGRIDSQVALDDAFAAVTGFYLLDTLIGGAWQALASAAWHLVLPVMTLTIATVAIIARVTRNTMVEVLSADHIRTLRAYGMPASRIHYAYALRATLIPLLTVAGLTYGYMLSGSIIVEYVFDWPGIGGYVVNGVLLNDFPAVLGATVMLAGAYLLINLFVDLAYFALDPRIARP